MRRRFYDPPGQFAVTSRSDARKLVDMITKVITAIAKKRFDIEVNLDAGKNLIPLVDMLTLIFK